MHVTNDKYNFCFSVLVFGKHSFKIALNISFSIQRKFHAKKVRFTIYTNLYGVHHIITNHTSGLFVLGFSSCTSVVFKLPECLSNASFWIPERAGIPRNVCFWWTFFYENINNLNCFSFSYDDHKTNVHIT